MNGRKNMTDGVRRPSAGWSGNMRAGLSTTCSGPKRVSGYWTPVAGIIRTAIHFLKNEDPLRARTVEEEGYAKGLDTGAFLVLRWKKPPEG
jgi:hypothetical protein